MLRTAATAIGSNKLRKAADGLLLLAALTILVACQGFSSGKTSTSQQTQSGTLSLASASLDFGSVTAGTSKTLTVIASNTGTASITVSSASISSRYFSLNSPSLPIAIFAGQSAPITFVFTPNAAGTFSGTVSITSNASNSSATLSLSGNGMEIGQLAPSTANENFGTVTVGSNQALSETITNTGTASVTISQIAISGTGFGLSGIVAPVTLTAGQSASFTVTFAPQSAANASGAVTLTSNASNSTLSIPLSGTGVTAGTLGSTPTSLGFGNVTVGNNQSLSASITNTGGSSVTVSQIAATGAGFSLSGIAAPFTLATGQSATFSVAFTPQSVTSASGSVNVTSNASNPSLTIPLSGTGISPGVLGPNPGSLNFGSVTVGNKQSLSETVTNTGGASVTISSATISGTGFSLSGITTPVTLTTGESATFSVTFAPASTGAASGSVTITSNASNPSLTIPLSGTGVAPGGLGSNPTSLAFGTVTVGNKQALSETVTNTGGSSVTISSATIGGSGFTLNGITTPVTLTAGQSTTFTVTFNPASAGSVTGNVTLTSNASNPTLTIPLSGTGVTPGALGTNPTSLSFGSVIVGNKQSLSETVTNTGGVSVTISSATISGAGFTLSGITAPVTLTAGQSATFTVTFTPASAGSDTGNVTLTSNGSNPTLTIPLAGTGIAPGTLGSNPTSLSFGSVTVGNKQSLSETVTNTGGASVTISQVAVSGTGFSFSGITTPVTLTSGQSATFTVTFTPASAGSSNGSVSITSNASNPNLNIPLSGTGVASGTLGSNPTSLGFGSVTVGNKQSLSETVTNTGGTSVTISQVAISGAGFSLSGITTPVTLTSGQSATFTVTFTPASAGSASGSVSITSNASNPNLNIPLSGSGVATGTLGSNPTSLSFGSVTVGSNQSLLETVTNTGGASVTISQVAISGTGFSLSGISTPVTLTSGQSASFTVMFTPASAGSASGNVTVTSNASNPSLTIPLSGTGSAAVGQLTVNPTTLNLGSVVVGTSGTASGSLTASGANVTITAANSNNSVFSVGGLSLPVTIPAGQSTSFTVTFSPLTTGVASGSLTFTSNAQPSTTVETLSGTGTPAPSHSVNLSWNASTSQNISGYNIYRSVYTSSCGSYSKINGVLNTGTLYTDSSVIDGTSYCYAATAVDTSDEESGYSNIVSNVQIPAP
jgi:Abnormal spindle-like microcephaly-assoc'd, ASPM-SPD-2-Hydin/Protein of unknown function (DUF1573)